MTEKEGNKIIAEWFYRDVKKLDLSRLGQMYFNYHRRWEELMTIVEKINTISPDNYSGNSTSRIKFNIAKKSVTELYISTPIETVWHAVVQFIQYYNTQQTS